ncbi:MAG: hypothetical protein K8W52_11185 [Deltaproteobacteria bacterium]|nr:hypothetical protein [Deltaproteobacteria bacterium]
MNDSFACFALVSMPSATPSSGTCANCSRLKISAESAKSREMRDMSSVTIALMRPAVTAAISSSKPGRSMLAPEIARSANTCAFAASPPACAMNSRHRRTWSSMLRSVCNVDENRA